MVEKFTINQTDERYKKMVGRKGGSKWPIWIVQLICELLVNGAPTSAVVPIIHTRCCTMVDENYSPKHLPPQNFVRGCRIIVQIIGETLTAFKLSKARSWEQLFTYGTSRREIAM